MSIEDMVHFLWWRIIGIFIVCAGDWVKKWLRPKQTIPPEGAPERAAYDVLRDSARNVRKSGG
jgi:hypothetical protein